MSREPWFARTVVELADTLVDEFDVVDLLTTLSDRCVEVFDVSAAGIMLVAPDGDLRLMTASSEAMRVVELFELQAREGPCVDCYRSGEPVVGAALVAGDTRWPMFTQVAVEAGFHAVDAIPMRLRRNVIGALNLFRAETSSMGDDDLLAAQALADVATIAILQHNAATSAQLVNQQLTRALQSRIVIEQAKGMIAERRQLDMGQAFVALRSHARNHNLRLADVASEITAGKLDIGTIGTIGTSPA
ncbi:MAG: GAF and ANTAR domain-containing protein [Ilumatobacteraceae bacterium]